MSLKKLTYSGAKCNNYIYFSFTAKHFDPNIVSQQLMIKPTSIKLKKDPIPKFSSWNYKIVIGEEIDFVSSLNELICLFESNIEKIVNLKEQFELETRLQFVIDIDIRPDASTPYFPFNKRLINFLAKTKTEVDFDIYKVDKSAVNKSE